MDADRPRSSLPPLDAGRLTRLTAYTLQFRGVISRADQRERLILFLRGLLDGAEPKNAEAIAARWSGGSGGSGTAQALQHFLGSSPWDHGQFLSCFRSRLPEARSDRLRLWVVQELDFPKKGQYSVGTQRQLARPVGRKINCQVAVAVSELRCDGFFPLALRLYLPGFWLREHRDLAERLVPAEHRSHLSKVEIALQLIDQLRQEGRPGDLVTADSGFLDSQDFNKAIQEREMQLLRPGEDASPVQDSISSPAALLCGSRDEWLALPNRDRDVRSGALARLGLAETGRGYHWLRQHLGLAQFEGRNWLGWHHHTALVLAAYGFLVTEVPSSPCLPLPSQGGFRTT